MRNLRRYLIFRLYFISLILNYNIGPVYSTSFNLEFESHSIHESSQIVISPIFKNGDVEIDGLDCEINYYNITLARNAEFEVKVSYSGGNSESYPEGVPINLGNGTLTAILQAGTLNTDGGTLVYKVVGKPDTTIPAIIPVDFGGKFCEITIYISEPSESSIDFWILSFNDKNQDCVRDEDEEMSNTDGLFIKVFDLDDKMVYSAPAYYGQFEVLGFNGLSDYIYYYIIDNNDFENDHIPTLNPGWKSGTNPYLKRYFYFFGGMTYFNITPESNLLDVSWDYNYPFTYRICLYQLIGKISALDCAKANLLQPIIKSISNSNLLTIAYEGANGGYYDAQSIQSIGITGITASLEAGFFNEGNGTINYSISGTSNAGGKGYFEINIGGQTCRVEFFVEDPQLSITKDLKQSTFKSVGDKLEYTLTVSNPGNVDLTDIIVKDPLTGLWEKLPLLKVGEKSEINTIYIAKQTDLDAGLLINTATASSNFKSNFIEVLANKTVRATQLPSISLRKTASQIFYSQIGDVLNYQLEINNTGNVTLLDVIVKDPLTSLNDTIEILSPKETKIIKTQYTITQSDLDAGKVTNWAKAEFIWEANTNRVEDTVVIIGDSDGDGVPDLVEKKDGTDPKDQCSFKLSNQTLMPSTQWNNADCDGDGVSNLVELNDRTDLLGACDFKLSNRNLSPSSAWNMGDCDGDGITNEADGADDCDKDGIPNFLDDDTCRIDILLPNVFSPNGDGINDVIKPILLGIEELICFKIYNRWGNLVFETKNRDFGWDGAFRASNQETETYMWLVEAYDRDGIIIKRTGMLTLLK